MLEHLNTTPKKPERVVVIGANGFVGKAICETLQGRNINVLPVGRAEIDLLENDAITKLESFLRPTDSLVLVAAIAPVKNLVMLQDNLKIIATFEGLLQNNDFAHVLNISSDAIYGDLDEPLTEASFTNAGTLHGIMHIMRELILKEAVGKIPFATLRPTLIYGANDPHNSYGPNRFRRLAAAGQDIILFGEGEERRDHVSIEDVVELAARILMQKSCGVLNVATGTVISFKEVAEAIVGFYDHKVTIKGLPRVGLMPHNGYRAFDSSATKQAFPDFKYIQPIDGFRKIFERN